MSTSTPQLEPLLAELTGRARDLGLTDTAWSARAGVRKETLSRLRSRSTCDFATLGALASAVGAQIVVAEPGVPLGTDPHFPARLDREYESRLLDLCASRSLEAERWAQLGPRFFMAGLAVMIAGTPGFDRRSFLSLAETLHPGTTEPAVFTRWLAGSPLRPSRFLPMLKVRATHAA